MNRRDKKTTKISNHFNPLYIPLVIQVSNDSYHVKNQNTDEKIAIAKKKKPISKLKRYYSLNNNEQFLIQVQTKFKTL